MLNRLKGVCIQLSTKSCNGGSIQDRTVSEPIRPAFIKHVNIPLYLMTVRAPPSGLCFTSIVLMCHRDINSKMHTLLTISYVAVNCLHRRTSCRRDCIADGGPHVTLHEVVLIRSSKFVEKCIKYLSY